MIKSGSGRNLLGKVVLGASLAALCTMMVACSGAGSTSASDGQTVGGAFLPAAGETGVVPQITAVTPSTLFPGEVLTLTGTGFGDQQVDTSRVRFSTDGINANLDAGSVAQSTDWTDTRVRIQVPSGAVTGPVQIVLNQRTANEKSSNLPTVNIKRAFDPNSTPKLIFVNPSQGQFVGQDSPITIIFDRPILLSSITGNPTISSAISLVSVAQPNPSPNPGGDGINPEGPCERPVVCDLRATDLIGCNCTQPFAVTAIEDISAELRAAPATAFRISHAPFSTYQLTGANGENRVISVRTVVVSVNNTVRADGSLTPDGLPRSTPGPNIPSTGEFRFFFVN